MRGEGGVGLDRRMSLQKPWLGVAHVGRRRDGGTFPGAASLRVRVFLDAVLVVRLGEEEVLGRDEEGGDGGDAVLQLLEGVYTVAKAVLNGDVGS